MTILEERLVLPNNQRQHRTLHIQKDVLPYALCESLCPVSATLASISRMDSISTSYADSGKRCETPLQGGYSLSLSDQIWAPHYEFESMISRTDEASSYFLMSLGRSPSVLKES